MSANDITPSRHTAEIDTDRLFARMRLYYRANGDVKASVYVGEKHGGLSWSSDGTLLRTGSVCWVAYPPPWAAIIVRALINLLACVHDTQVE